MKLGAISAMIIYCNRLAGDVVRVLVLCKGTYARVYSMYVRGKGDRYVRQRPREDEWKRGVGWSEKERMEKESGKESGKVSG